MSYQISVALTDRERRKNRGGKKEEGKERERKQEREIGREGMEHLLLLKSK